MKLYREIVTKMYCLLLTERQMHKNLSDVWMFEPTSNLGRLHSEIMLLL